MPPPRHDMQNPTRVNSYTSVELLASALFLCSLPAPSRSLHAPRRKDLTLAAVMRRITMSDERGTTFQSVDEYRPYYTVTVPAGICPLHYLSRMIGDDSTSLESVLLDVVRSANTGVQRDERARPRIGTSSRVCAGGGREFGHPRAHTVPCGGGAVA